MSNERYVAPQATLTEKPEAYEIKFTVPGVGKDAAELHVEGRTLTLKTNASHQNPAGFKQVAAEFTRENYAMSVDLPELADAETTAAKMENGILTVTVKKRPETQARKIAIG